MSNYSSCSWNPVPQFCIYLDAMLGGPPQMRLWFKFPRLKSITNIFKIKSISRYNFFLKEDKISKFAQHCIMVNKLMK